MMKSKVILTKEKTNIIYGCAICLMVFHHLFGFPERIPNSYIAIFNFDFLHIETLVAYFGKICISLYAFISGYGLIKKSKNVSNVFSMCIHQIKKFYCYYWIIFIVFIPYGFLNGIYSFEIKTIIGNFIGWYCTYNSEWWYVKQYIIMLLLFPFICIIYEYTEKFLQKRIRIGVVLFGIIGISLIFEFTRYLMVFLLGVVFSKEDIFEMMDSKISFRNIIASVALICVFMIRTLFGGTGQLDLLLTPVFIYAVCVITDIETIKRFLNPVIKIFGKYSIYIWLTHTFFGYYYFQNIVFVAKYSVLIFIWTMMICLALALFIDNCIVKHFNHVRR